MFLITREILHYVHLRQAYFLSPFMTSRISSKTVLFVDVPESYRDEQYLRRMFPQVRTVWLVCDPANSEDLVEERDAAATKLERGEVKMIQNYLKERKKNDGKNANASEDGVIQIEDKHRPVHRLKPIIGKKVDTVNWAKGELHRLLPQVSQAQGDYCAGRMSSSSSCFLEFDSVRAAQVAFQQVSHQNPLRMTAKEVGMTPDQVIWKNVGKPWWHAKVIELASTGFVAFLCIFWTLPVALIGVITVRRSLISHPASELTYIP